MFTRFLVCFCFLSLRCRCDCPVLSLCLLFVWFYFFIYLFLICAQPNMQSENLPNLLNERRTNTKRKVVITDNHFVDTMLGLYFFICFLFLSMHVETCRSQEGVCEGKRTCFAHYYRQIHDGWLDHWFVGWLIDFCLVYLVDWLIGWLAGWLAG